MTLLDASTIYKCLNQSEICDTFEEYCLSRDGKIVNYVHRGRDISPKLDCGRDLFVAIILADPPWLLDFGRICSKIAAEGDMGGGTELAATP